MNGAESDTSKTCESRSSRCGLFLGNYMGAAGGGVPRIRSSWVSEVSLHPPISSIKGLGSSHSEHTLPKHPSFLSAPRLFFKS